MNQNIACPQPQPTPPHPARHPPSHPPSFPSHQLLAARHLPAAHQVQPPSTITARRPATRCRAAGGVGVAGFWVGFEMEGMPRQVKICDALPTGKLCDALPTGTRSQVDPMDYHGTCRNTFSHTCGAGRGKGPLLPVSCRKEMATRCRAATLQPPIPSSSPPSRASHVSCLQPSLNRV